MCLQGVQYDTTAVKMGQFHHHLNKVGSRRVSVNSAFIIFHVSKVFLIVLQEHSIYLDQSLEKTFLFDVNSDFPSSKSLMNTMSKIYLLYSSVCQRHLVHSKKNPISLPNRTGCSSYPDSESASGVFEVIKSSQYFI